MAGRLFRVRMCTILVIYVVLVSWTEAPMLAAMPALRRIADDVKQARLTVEAGQAMAGK